MNVNPIAKIEAQLENLIEKAVTNLFSRRATAHDIAVKLARSMTENVRSSQSGDGRLLAPTLYTIVLHPTRQELMVGNAALAQALSEHIVALAVQSGYRLTAPPTLRWLADPNLPREEVRVLAAHEDDEAQSTTSMKPVQIPKAQPAQTPYFLLGERMIPLEKSVINIGRSDDNDIILDDPYTSRHHVQLRLRFGVYTLFDVNSRGGTFVNNVAVREHRLASGDVVRIGSTQLVFLHGANKPSEPPAQTTDAMPPVGDV